MDTKIYMITGAALLGFALLMIFMLAVTFSDVFKLFQ